MKFSFSVKSIFSFASISMLFAVSAHAQSPEKINYQSVIRNSAGETIEGSNVGLELIIRQGSSSGSAVYTETHSPTTNDFGLVNLQLGNGSSGDDFSAIDWANGPYFLSVGLDASGGTSYTTMGTSELVSVPFALMATNVQNDAVDDADADATNELLMSAVVVGTDLVLEDAGGIFTIDMTAFLDNDADSTNEFQTISLSGNDLLLSDNGGNVDLSSYLDNTDAQTLSNSSSGTDRTVSISNGNSVTFDVEDNDNSTSNEIQNLSSTTSGTNRTINISSGSGTTISIADNDNSTTNEIQTLSFSNDDLTLSNGGGTVSLPYDSSYWQIDADTIYSMDEHVAIGADGAESRLYVSTDGTNTNVGIEAHSNVSGSGRAIIGRAYSQNASTSNQYGVIGFVDKADGASTGGSGIHVGVAGESFVNNTSCSNYGFSGIADGLGVNNFGIRGTSGDSANVRNYGGYFETTGQDDNFNIGVLSFSDGIHTGTNYAFYGVASGANTNYAGFFSGDVNVTGNLTNTSDRALKTNIEPYQGAIDAIKNVGTYSYEYKVDDYKHMHLPSGNQVGFIAQDLEETFPNLVSVQHAPTEAATDIDMADVSVEESFTTYKGVNYIGMIPVLTQAIKEQQEMIEAQKQRIEDLEKRLEKLED